MSERRPAPLPDPDHHLPGGLARAAERFADEAERLRGAAHATTELLGRRPAVPPDAGATGVDAAVRALLAGRLERLEVDADDVAARLLDTADRLARTEGVLAAADAQAMERWRRWRPREVEG